MKVLVFQDSGSAARAVAQEIVQKLAKKSDLVLGLATGSTPIGVYAELSRWHREEGVDFSAVRTFNLDEYVGLPPSHKQSYHHFMEANLFRHVNISPANIHFPPTDFPNLEAKCEAFEQKIDDCGGIDIQILGIGSNGHIGFNEPTSSLASRTRIKTLTRKTLEDNSRFYGPDEQPPHLAVTMGIGTILRARRILLQAFGSRKAEAVRAGIERPISSFWPGSALQLHPDTTFFLDNESASKLTLREYYQAAQENDRRLRLENLL